MGNIITVIKPKEYRENFIQFSRNAFAELVNKTKSKTVVALWVFLAGNANGFSVTVTPKCIEGLWGLDRGVAENISRSLKELRELGYINENNEFYEYGWKNAGGEKIGGMDIENEGVLSLF